MMAIRFSDEDRQLLDALVRRKNEQLAGEGVEVSASSVIRGLVRQAATELGVTASPPAAPEPKPSKRR